MCMGGRGMMQYKACYGCPCYSCKARKYDECAMDGLVMNW